MMGDPWKPVEGDQAVDGSGEPMESDHLVDGRGEPMGWGGACGG